VLSREEARKLIDRVLKHSQFPDCEVSVEWSEHVYVRFANNGITTSGLARRHEIVVSSTKERRTGEARTSEIDDASLSAAVRRSEAIAAMAPPNEEWVEPLGEQEYPALPEPDPDTMTARSPLMVPHIRVIVEKAKEKGLVAAGFFERLTRVHAIANKRGNFGYHVTADASLSTTARTAAGDSSGWASRPSTTLHTINGAQLGAAAIEKCLEWRKPRRLEPGRYTVVLEPTATGDLARFVGLAMSARDAEEGRSFLSIKGGGTLLGQKLFPETVTLRTDPFDARFPSLPWSADGLPSRAITWIEKGVVKNLRYDRYWAQKSEKPPSPALGFPILEGSERSLSDLIAATERGLLVTRFWYIRPVNPRTLQMTGLTRDGLFLIENGKIAGPVMNLRFNESPVEMLKRARMAGRAVRVRGAEGSGMLAPALLVDDFTFTSVSDAV
jgi:predicted Zn-dependent protease